MQFDDRFPKRILRRRCLRLTKSAAFLWQPFVNKRGLDEKQDNLEKSAAFMVDPNVEKYR